MEVAVEAIHGEQHGLSRLGSEEGDVLVVEDVLRGPDRDAPVSEVAHERRPAVEGGGDGGAGGAALLAQEDGLDGMAGGEQGGDPLGAALEIAAAVGIVRDEDGRPLGKGQAGGLERDDLVHERVGFLQGRGGEPAEGEVRQQVVAVDRRVGGIGGGPQVRRLHEQRRQRVRRPAVKEVLVIVRGVAEQQHVSKRGSAPEMVGVGDEVADGLGRRLAVAELLIDLFERGRFDDEALPLPQVEQGLHGGKEGVGTDDQVLGAIEPAAQRAGDRRPHLRMEQVLRREGEVSPAGLHAEGEPALRRRSAEEPLRRIRRREVEQ